MSKFHGISYPPFFSWALSLWLWRWLMCRRGYHVLDEVYSPSSDHPHCLVCDACQLVVNIASIDETYVPPHLKKKTNQQEIWR